MSKRLATKIVLVLVAVFMTAAGETLAAKPEADETVTEMAVEVRSVAAVTDDLVPATAACDESDQLNYTPAVARAENSTDESLVAAAGCKRCPDRPWCACRYNGLPRVSCNPCCYGNLGIPQVCLD